MLRKSFFTVACLSILSLCGTANAITILSSQSAGSIPGVAGTGLSAAFYKFSSAIGSLSQADSLVAGSSGPAVTWTATNICYPSCLGSANDGNSVASWIASGSSNVVGSSTLGTDVVRFNGYIAIATAGNYTFGLFSDDGSVLTIGGTTIYNNDGLHGVAGTTTAVTFQGAGLYSFYLDFFENGGGTGVTVQENGSTLTTASLYSSLSSSPIPEPPAFALMAMGIGFAGIVRGRRLGFGVRAA